MQDVAEVEMPQGAYVLKLRTSSPTAGSLEPENIEGKDTCQLPGVQVGDFVEYEYLLAHPPRGPAQPGFTSSSFYFQIARQPNNWSTYMVIAPKGSGHEGRRAQHEGPAAASVKGDVRGASFTKSAGCRRTSPSRSGPPSGNEWLPFVIGGRGADAATRAWCTRTPTRSSTRGR